MDGPKKQIYLFEMAIEMCLFQFENFVFSNLKSPNGFPNPGKDSQSIEWLIQQSDVPYESEELEGLQAIENLIQW